MSNPLFAPSPSSSPSANALANQFRKDVVGQWFNGTTVALDGYVFINCRFDNCNLTVASTQFKLVNCWVDPNCRIFYQGETVKIIQLFTKDFDLDEGAWGGFVPKRNADGTITIGV